MRGERADAWPVEAGDGRPSRKEQVVKLGLVAVVVLVWLGAKVAYDAAYVPSAAHRFPLVVNLDDQVLLEGYDLSGVGATSGTAVTVQPGASLTMTVFWRTTGSETAPAASRSEAETPSSRSLLSFE